MTPAGPVVAFLDLGVYPVQLTSLVLGTPETIVAHGRIGPTGVDELVAAVLGFAGGAVAVVKASITTNLACTARIVGTDGVIELPAFMHCPQSITVVRGTEREEADTSWEGEGLRFQVEEVHRCLAAGEPESPGPEVFTYSQTCHQRLCRLQLDEPFS